MADAPLSVEWLEDVFSYHAPSEAQRVSYEELRKGAKEFAICIAVHCPPCADRTVAVRLVREAVMVANASIALNGLV